MGPGIDFRSDNSGCAAPEFISAIAAANHDTASGYGGDALTAQVQDRFSELFETPVRVFPVATGTAANAVALAAVSTPFGAVYCHGEAHINMAECNATSFFGGGTKLVSVDGPHGKLDPAALSAALSAAGTGLTHKSQPAAINLVQASDLGAIYQPDEVARISEIARRHRLTLHMDGARFANAMASLGCSPAEATWRNGVDVLSFGVTKNGGLLADAIVIFDDRIARDIGFHLRRAGLVWSKMRFASAQLLAALQDGLWLRLAGQANAMATRLAHGLQRIDGVTLLAPVQANEVFMASTPAMLSALEGDGVLFFRRGESAARFVCRWDTQTAQVDELVNRVARHAHADAAN